MGNFVSAASQRTAVRPDVASALERRIVLLLANGDGDVWVWRTPKAGQYTAVTRAFVPPYTDPDTIARGLTHSFFSITMCGPRLRMVAWRPPVAHEPGWTDLYAYTCPPRYVPAGVPLASGHWVGREEITDFIAGTDLEAGVAEVLRVYATVTSLR